MDSPVKTNVTTAQSSIQQFFSGHFGHVNNIFNQDLGVQIKPYRNMANQELILRQFLLNYIFSRQRLSDQISIPLNLSNINISKLNFTTQCDVIAIFNNIMNLSIASRANNSQLARTWLKETSNFNTNISMPLTLLNSIVDTQRTLAVLKEFSLINQSDYDYITALINSKNVCNNQPSVVTLSECNNQRKRQAPDYDNNFNLNSSKRIRFQNIDFSNDDFEPHESNYVVEMQNFAEDWDAFKVITTKWKVQRLANPNIDYTHRELPNLINNLQYDSVQSQQRISCLTLFDDEIKNVEIQINKINHDIMNLNNSSCFGFPNSGRSYDQIIHLRQHEIFLKDKYASLCEARDEIFLLYMNSRYSPLSFDGEYISITEADEHTASRRMISDYKNIYN